MKKIINFSFAFLAICLIAVPASLALGVSPIVGIGTATALSFIPSGENGVAYAGLNKEIWLPEILEGFYADWMFVTEMRDLSSFVENNTINLAEAGVNPEVFVNSSGPISYAQRTDVPIALPLDTFDTENTLVTNIEKAELSYDKRASVLFGHKMSLQMEFLQRAAFAVAPANDTTFTPKLVATGADNAETGLKRLSYKDILKLKKRFNNAEIPATGRVLVLTSQHQEDLEAEDAERFNRVMEKGVLCGFKLYELADTRLPRYHKSTGVKYAYAAANDSNVSYASIAFHKMECAYAQGDIELFLREKDPELRGDMFGVQQRMLTTNLRNKGIAAIYSPAI